MIQEKEGIPREHQQLIAEGRKLDDARTLMPTAFEVVDGAVKAKG